MDDPRYVLDDLERLYRRACGTLDALSVYYKRSLVVAALRGFEKHGADPKHPAGTIHSALWHLREEVARLRTEAPGAPAMLAFAEAARDWFTKAKDPAFNGKDHDAGHRERWDRMTKAYDAIDTPTPASPARETCPTCGSKRGYRSGPVCLGANPDPWHAAPAKGHDGKEGV